MPDLASALGDGWTELDRDVMGELFLAALLQGGLPVETANMAADGWGGDTYLLLEEPTGNEALVSVSTWDTVEDFEAFRSALMQYFQGITGAEDWVEQEPGEGESAHRIASDDVAVEIRSVGDRVWLTVASDMDTVDQIVAALTEIGK